MTRTLRVLLTALAQLTFLAACQPSNAAWNEENAASGVSTEASGAADQSVFCGERRERLSSPHTIEELKRLLDEYKIPYAEWGKGKATNTTTKDITSLFQELQEEESHLVAVSANGKKRLEREIRIVLIRIYGWVHGEWYVVVEDGQVRVDDPDVVYHRAGSASISEKMKATEDPLDAVYRGLWEELKIEPDRASWPEFIRSGGGHRASNSYEGFMTTSTSYQFRLVVIGPDVNARYAEYKPAKTIYWKWTKLSELDNTQLIDGKTKFQWFHDDDPNKNSEPY